MRRASGRFAVMVAAALAVSPFTGIELRAQEQPVDPDLPPHMQDADKEAFLKKARIGRMQDIGVGVTGTRRATLDDGRVKHDAHVQTIDVFNRGVTQLRGQAPEINFRDSYKFNIAGYRLDRLLHLNMVPVSVERTVNREQAAVTWWVDDVQMMELERYKKNITPPDASSWADQMFTAKVFTERSQFEQNLALGAFRLDSEAAELRRGDQGRVRVRVPVHELGTGGLFRYELLAGRTLLSSGDFGAASGDGRRLIEEELELPPDAQYLTLRVRDASANTRSYTLRVAPPAER